MNKRIALRGKKINKIEYIGVPLSHDENKIKVLSNTSGIPLNILKIFFPD